MGSRKRGRKKSKPQPDDAGCFGTEISVPFSDHIAKSEELSTAGTENGKKENHQLTSIGKNRNMSKPSYSRSFPMENKTNDPEHDSFNVPKAVKIYSVITLVLAMLFVLPRGLHRSGITETDVTEDFEEFVKQTLRPKMEQAWGIMMDNISELTALSEESSLLTDRNARPGYKLAQLGVSNQYPVVMVPGFVTSGLELWSGEECARKHFRKRMWGSLNMANTFISDRDCWRRHMTLDPYDGMDPENGRTIRLRAAQGFEAADYFMSNYWVFGKLIENLADVGYDSSNMAMLSYDWRVSFPLLEKRDGYLSKLRYAIEAFHGTSGKKVVLISHSMGTTLSLFFLNWVTRSEKEGGGGGKRDWVEKHVHAFVNVAGAVLGCPRTAPALLSGEMKDTSVLLGTLGEVVEQFFGRKQRKDMFATWGALWSLLPKGGDAIWGVGADIINPANQALNGHRDTGKSAKEFSDGTSLMPLVSFTDSDDDHECPVGNKTKTHIEQPPVCRSHLGKIALSRNVSVEEYLTFLRSWGSGYGSDLSAAKLHAFRTANDLRKRKPVLEDWHNPAVTPLPRAPSMKIYCLYGTGLDTERAYFYKKAGVTLEAVENGKNISFSDPPFVMDLNVTNVDHNVKNGVQFSDGDGTVPLVSLGYMCVDGWARKGKKYSTLNPSGSTVVTREYPHKYSFDFNDPMRNGPYSADHVDILGNIHFMEDVLKIVTDFNVSTVSQKVTSDIETIAKRINDHSLGGIKGKRR